MIDNRKREKRDVKSLYFCVRNRFFKVVIWLEAVGATPQALFISFILFTLFIISYFSSLSITLPLQYNAILSSSI